MTTSPDSDLALRFLFEQADIRGELVQLDHSLRDIFAVHEYPAGVRRLLGQFLAAATLLSTNLKFQGKLVLQARSEGQIALLMAECDSDLNIRAIARGADQARSTEFADLLGRGGHLAITIDPDQGKRYQGIVPLDGDCLAHSLDQYFEQSEQLSTRFWLACDGERAAGMLLQQLPAQQNPSAEERDQQWEHACTLAETLREDELLSVSPTDLLYRLYHQDPVRLFPGRPVRFHCSCSLERSRNALSALDAAELLDILRERGEISVDCEFCNRQYRFQREDLAELLPGSGERTLH
ncbi:MAG: Hsp33 family molecular chaperone HslO [Haliea sp.]|nr:Hsp33 family molecular chaperone HslO [Haliea sp.]|tara:strand:- start:80524 stop:81408 length:885 start_codon:yes stop_codon:yes gene_type:complete